MIRLVNCRVCGKLLAKQTQEVIHIKVRTGSHSHTDIICKGEVSITCPAYKHFSDGPRMCGAVTTINTSKEAVNV